MDIEGTKPPEDQPGIASADRGVVLLDGPQGITLALTPDAASITGYSLVAAAEKARRFAPNA